MVEIAERDLPLVVGEFLVGVAKAGAEHGEKSQQQAARGVGIGGQERLDVLAARLPDLAERLRPETFIESVFLLR